MHAEDSCRVFEREAINVAFIVLKVLVVLDIVLACLGELVLSVENVRVVELSQDCHQAPPVPVISHPSSVVDLPSHKQQRLEGHTVSPVQKHCQHGLRCFQV